jgi:LDH2 family malate/lactate/ureidoglycolate dehydrogenase
MSRQGSQTQGKNSLKTRLARINRISGVKRVQLVNRISRIYLDDGHRGVGQAVAATQTAVIINEARAYGIEVGTI